MRLCCVLGEDPGTRVAVMALEYGQILDPPQSQNRFPYMLWKMTETICPTWYQRWLFWVWYGASDRVEALN